MAHRAARLLLHGGTISISTNDFLLPERFNYGDNEHFLKVFILSYVKLLNDSPLLESNGDKPASTYMSFFRMLCEKNLVETIKLYSGYADTILSNEYSTGSDSSTRVFHDFMKDTPVFKEYLSWLRSGRPDLLQFVLTFLLFGKKINYVSEEFHTVALRDWYAVEDELKTLEFSSIDLANLKLVVSTITRPINLSHHTPAFGPGHVCESRVTFVPDKLKILSWNKKLAFAFNRAGFLARKRDDQHEIVDQFSRDSVSYSRLKMVPKDITKSRSICMEPNAHMYFQQEVMDALVLMMEKAPIRRFVDLSSQSKSQHAAIHGSLYLSSDTIDLSAASDRVHIDLVKGVFQPSTLFFLLGTRTSKVKVPDKKEPIDVKKFAPMGSAVCFPIQCILFTSICLYAYYCASRSEATGTSLLDKQSFLDFLKRGLHSGRRSDTAFTKRYEPPVVYGDDICVDSRLTQEVISALTRLGFKVNESKSFTSSQSFRESCGVFAYEGEEVTPLRFRLPWFKQGKWDASVYSSLIGAINVAREKGYHSLASFYLSILKDYGFQYPLPFTSDRDAFGIFTCSKHVVKPKFLRYNADWQCNEEVQMGIVPRDIKFHSSWKDDSYLYDQWWRARMREHLSSPFAGKGLRIRPQETRIGPRWARAE